jgi:multidrug efflux system outer membrane protein
MMRIRSIFSCVSAVTLAACVNLSPTYESPALSVSGGVPASGLEQSTPMADVGYAEFYGDSALRELIELALVNNRDLRTTALAVDSARAQLGIARAAALPSVDGTLASTAQHNNGVTSRGVSAGVGISAFEVDLFGRLRNQRQMAVETLASREESLRAVRLSLVSQVASAYATLLADRQRLRLAEDTLASQQTSFALTQRTFEAGSSSALDVAQAQTSVDTARVDIVTYRTRVSQDLNALVLLVGQPIDSGVGVQADATAYGDSLLAFSENIGVPANVPATALERRPDVMAAERSLRAAYFNIGAARAARWPSIRLTTSVGSASNDLSGLFDSGARTWSFLPSLVLPIFDGGASAANVRVAKIARETALAAYDSAIQNAFREVADALAQRHDIDELLAARQSLLAAAEKSFRLSDARYRRGVDSYLSTLDAQRYYYTAQQSMISARLLEANNLISLYGVMGGGWK